MFIDNAKLCSSAGRRKSKAEALESQITLCGELRGMKKDNNCLKKFYSPLNPAERRTCTCKVLGANYLKIQMF